MNQSHHIQSIKLILNNDNIKTITNFSQPINDRYKNKFVPQSYYDTIKYKKGSIK